MSKLSDVLGLPRDPKDHSLHIAIMPLSHAINDKLVHIAYTKSIIPTDYIINTTLIESVNVYQVLANLAADGIDAIITIGTCYSYTSSIGDIVVPSVIYANTSSDLIDPYSLYANVNINESIDITSSSADLRCRFDLHKIKRGHYDTLLYEVENACKDLKLIHIPLQVITNCYDSATVDMILRGKSDDLLAAINKCYMKIHTQFTNIGEA